MDETKQQIIGSRARDMFRRMHKELNAGYYCLDGDLILVEKYPPVIAAYLDYKLPMDYVTFAEAIAYNQWVQTTPVYVIEERDILTGEFLILEYLHGNWRPEPPVIQWGQEWEINDWSEYSDWEHQIRQAARFGKRLGR